MRKLIIGLIAVGFVASLFLGYALIMDAEPIEVRNVAGSDDLEMPESGGAAQQAGDAVIHEIRKSRYVDFDPETNEISRVFGFEELLNPGMETSRWQVKKPYLIFYESNYQYRIESDTGMFQVETSGSSSTPKDARLNGNVKIHVTPKPGSKMSETIVKMDDLVFSSERSEFATDRKVHIKSDQVELKGTGLIVIFDSANGKVDYLQIRDLEEIRLQGMTDSKPETKSGTKIAKAETDTASANLTSTPPADDSSIPSEKVDGAEVELLRYYQCILEDNVEIKYGNKIVIAAADQVNIQNILFSKLDQGVGVDGASERAKDKPKRAAKPGQPSDKGAKTESNIEPEPEILVTCDGGIILKPMQDEDAEQTPVAQSALSVGMGNTPLRVAKIIPDSQQTPTIYTVNLAGEEDVVVKSDTAKALPVADDTALKAVSDSNDSPPAKFKARKIDYDLLTGSGLAHGPVRFTFYQQPDPNSTTPTTPIPVTVTADENARFIADSSGTINQIVFNENVLAERRSQQTEFTQLDHLHGNKLAISLDENAEGEPDISHISMTEGKVYVQSQKLKDEQLLSNVKLYCTEIAYSQIDDEIMAKGPGEIILNNSHVPDPNTSEKNAGVDFNRPCYALIEGFDSIQWNLAEEKIVADGQQDQLKLSYVPLVDGKPDKYIFVDSIRFDLSFITDAAGKPDLKRVFTDKPIKYTEKDGSNDKTLHTVVGGKLDYDATDGGWVKIEETPAQPCYLDGVRMPEVLVHPATGRIDTSISTTPGVLGGR